VVPTTRDSPSRIALITLDVMDKDMNTILCRPKVDGKKTFENTLQRIRKKVVIYLYRYLCHGEGKEEN